MRECSAGLYALLVQAADAGEKCPTNGVLGAALGYTQRQIGDRLRYLVEDGFIRITYCDRGWRVVHILSSCNSTADRPAPVVTPRGSRRMNGVNAALEDNMTLAERVARDQAALHAERLRALETAQVQSRRRVRDIYWEMSA
jgi:hypothetical protein